MRKRRTRPVCPYCKGRGYTTRLWPGRNPFSMSIDVLARELAASARPCTCEAAKREARK